MELKKNGQYLRDAGQWAQLEVGRGEKGKERKEGIREERKSRTKEPIQKRVRVLWKLQGRESLQPRYFFHEKPS